MKGKLLFLYMFLLSVGTMVAQNPIISGQFTADPTARVFNGKIYDKLWGKRVLLLFNLSLH